MAKNKQKKKQGGGQQFLSPEQYLRQKARTLEIGTCYVTNDIDEVKMGHVIVSRRHTGGRISMACYLVDMACLGVKDSFYKLRMEDYEFEDFLGERRDMFRECSYEEAHNRVWGSLAYAEEAGIAPDKSFQLTKYMLEEDTDDVPLIDYEYGRDGQHFLTCRTELEASRYLPLMRKNLGEGNFKYIIGIGDPGFDDEDEYDEDIDDETTTFHGLPVDHLNMADIVNAISVDGIKYVSMVMDIGIHDIEDEAEMRRKYVDYILKHPEKLLSGLPKSEMDTLLFLYTNRRMAKGVPTANMEKALLMVIAGVADTFLNNEDVYCIRVADDFLKVALPLAADIRMSEEAQRRYEVEAIIEGMANLYGGITLEDVKRGVMMAKGGFRSEAGMLINEVMEHSLLLNFMVCKVDPTKTGIFALSDDNVAFSSPYCWINPKELFKAIANSGGGSVVADAAAMPTQPFTDDGAYRFTTDEFVEAGSGDVPTIPNKQEQVFWRFLTHELEWEDYYARRICFELWFRVNHADDPDFTNDESIEEYFEEEALAFDDISENKRQKGLSLLADYVAHIPRWTLKGHTPADGSC